MVNLDSRDEEFSLQRELFAKRVTFWTKPKSGKTTGDQDVIETQDGAIAARNDRTRPHGRQHGAAASQGRPRVRGLRQVAESRAGAHAGLGGGRVIARGVREEAR